jgi:hypothetical protein
VGKQGAYPRVEHLKGATWIGSGLTRNNWIRLERIVRDKHSSLVKKIVNYVRKKFDNIGRVMRICEDCIIVRIKSVKVSMI